MSRLKPLATRYEIFATVFLLGIGLLIAIGRPVVRRFSAHPSQEACEALLERYVEHVVHAIEPKPIAGELSLRKTEARSIAAESHAFANCASYLTQSEVACAMRAGNADELERCLP